MTTEFKSWRSYWNFATTVKQHARYVRDAESEAFLATVLATARGRLQRIKKGGIVWRAQVGHAWLPIRERGKTVAEAPTPYPPERMKPEPHRASEGRANPRGIPHLYAATDRETAIAEVRPWIGSLVSVAQLKIRRTLTIVNCSDDGASPIFFFEEPDAKTRADTVWLHIDRAFAEPVARSEDYVDYVPTQILSEMFKSHGFDGIAYRSALGKGHNLALFDLRVADVINGSLFEVKSVTFRS